MALYLSGLLLMTASIELTLALLLAARGAVPSPSSAFWLLYLTVDIALIAGAGLLIARGLLRLRTGSVTLPSEAVAWDPPPG
jgi:hypothetical protein